MPKPTPEHLEKVRSEGPIRLGCRGGCFRDDFDGVHLLPHDWQDIDEVQSLEASLTTYEDDDPDRPRGYSVSDWETHMGLCPECQSADEPLVVEAGVC